LVAVHHDISNVAVTARCVGHLAAEEDTSVRVHGGLVRGYGLVELPKDDALGVVKQVLTNTRNILNNGNTKFGELLLGAKTREEHQARGIDGASAENGLALRVEGTLLAGLECNVNAGNLVALDVDLADPRVGEDSQVVALLLATKDRMNVGNTSAASSAVVGVV
jgi:hypothetical protein